MSVKPREKPTEEERFSRQVLRQKKQIKKALARGIPAGYQRQLKRQFVELEEMKKTGPQYTVTYEEDGKEKEKTFSSSDEANRFIDAQNEKAEREYHEALAEARADADQERIQQLGEARTTQMEAEKAQREAIEAEALKQQQQMQVVWTTGTGGQIAKLKEMGVYKPYIVTWEEGGVKKEESFATESEAQSFVDTFEPVAIPMTGKTRTQQIRAKRAARRKKLKKLGKMELVGPGKKAERKAALKGEEVKTIPVAEQPTITKIETPTLAPPPIARDKRQELKDIRESQASLSTRQHLMKVKADALQDLTITNRSEADKAIKEVKSFQNMIDNTAIQVGLMKENLMKKIKDTEKFAQSVMDNKEKYTQDSYGDFLKDYGKFQREADKALASYDSSLKDLTRVKVDADKTIIKINDFKKKGAELSREEQQQRLRRPKPKPVSDQLSNLVDRVKKRGELKYTRATAVKEGETLEYRRARSREEVKDLYKKIEAGRVPTAELKTLTTREIEEGLEQGLLDPAQVTQYFIRGKGQFSIVTPKEQPTKTVNKLLDTWLTRANYNKPMAGYPDYSAMKVGSISEVAELLGPAPGKKLWELTPTERKARLDHARYTLGAGVLAGVVATVDPRTYVGLAKDTWGFVKDPYGSTGRRSQQLKKAFASDPEGFFYQLAGSTVGSYLTGISLSKLGGAVAPGVKSAIKTGGQKLKSAYRGAQSKFMDAIQGTWLDEAIESGKVSPQFLETDTFTHGPPSLWDEFRQYMKYKYDFIDVDPAAAKKPGILSEFKSYMKVRADFLKTTAADPGKIGIWDEFKSYFKTTPDFIKAQKAVSGPSGLLTKAKIWWRLHQAKMAKDVDNWLQPVAKLDDLKVGGPKTPWYKTGMGMADMPYPSKAAQGQASTFFKALSKEGVESQVKGFYNHLVGKGISAGTASEMASNYAIALVAMETAKAAKSTSAAISALEGIGVALNASNKLAKSGKEKNLVLDMMDSLVMDLRTNIATGYLKLYPNALKLSDTLKNKFEKTGKVDDKTYQKLLTTLFSESGLKPADLGKLDIDQLTPSIVSPAREEDLLRPEMTLEEKDLEVAIPMVTPVGNLLLMEVPQEPVLIEKPKREVKEALPSIVVKPLLSEQVVMEELEKLTPEEISKIPLAVIRTLEPKTLNAMLPDLIEGLSPSQIQQLTPIQIGVLLPRLARGEIQLTGPQLGVLPAQWQNLAQKTITGQKWRERLTEDRRRYERKIPLAEIPVPYKVRFQYDRGGETIKIRAKSFREAYGKANSQRKQKLSPADVEIEKLTVGARK